MQWRLPIHRHWIESDSPGQRAAEILVDYRLRIFANPDIVISEYNETFSGDDTAITHAALLFEQVYCVEVWRQDFLVTRFGADQEN
jgi:hypothetical protein